MTSSLIHVTDVQEGFVTGNLAVPGAPLLIAPALSFLHALRPGQAAGILFTCDTHYPGEYPHSPEKLVHGFPDHCLYATPDQRPLLAVPGLAVPGFFINKNEFDFWGNNPTDTSRISFADRGEQRSYANLFRVTPVFNDLTPGVPRDEWLDSLGGPRQTAITLFGLASDYCVLDALRGYLVRGYGVTVLGDLCAGIGGNQGRGASGRIEDVCALNFPRELAAGQLVLTTSREWLNATCAIP